MNVHAGLRPTTPAELAHQIELGDVSKTFAAVRALDSVSLAARAGRIACHHRTVGGRQDDALPDHRGSRDTGRGRLPHRREGRRLGSGGRAPRRLYVRVLRALSAPDGAGERAVAADRAQRSRDRHRRRRCRAGFPRDTPPQRAVAGRIVRRPETAGRARAHPRPKARRDAARRADLPSRRQAAPQAALRNPPHRHVATIADALVHARCDGSAIGRGSRCRHRRGPHRADRHAGGTVAPAGDGAGGTPRRRSADEPASGTRRIRMGPGARHSCAPNFAFR